MLLKIEMTKHALKNFNDAPLQVQIKFEKWVEGTSRIGLFEMRKVPSYHDEPLKGKRAGQRSIRLNRQWRAIYHTKEDHSLEIIEILEITPHDY